MGQFANADGTEEPDLQNWIPVLQGGKSLRSISRCQDFSSLFLNSEVILTAIQDNDTDDWSAEHLIKFQAYGL